VAGTGVRKKGGVVDLARNLIQRINVGDSLTRSAAARPDHLAVVDGARRWTCAEFNGWVNQVAHGLAARGYARGDALGLASANSAEFLAVYFACAKAQAGFDGGKIQKNVIRDRHAGYYAG
jgi:acyl-CoA synthetase (AMP-forming)/AMP-acid ligase II